MKSLLVFVIFYSTLVFGQNGQELKYQVLNPDHAGKIFRNPKKASEKPLGTPYKTDRFILTQVSNVAQKAFMRYNIYTDEFEFLNTKNDTLILDKFDDFNTIIFNDIEKYKLLNYTYDDKPAFGYLIEIYSKEDLAFYKKEKVDFYQGKTAKTSLERDMPSKYVKANAIYFFRTKDNIIIEFPRNKKQLIKLYSNKKEAIETFFKENKTNFENENDLKKVIDLIATF